MPNFTIFYLDEGGVVQGSRLIELPDEEEAKSFADRLLVGFPRVEVWEGAILVHRALAPVRKP